MATHLHPLLIPLFGVALATLAGCAGLDAQGSGPAAEAPVFRVGDRWVYRAEDGFRMKTPWEETHEVTAIGPDGVTVRVTQKGPSIDVARTERWSAPGQLAVGAAYNSETRRFATPLKRYEFPLAGGKTWNQWVDNYNEATRATGSINRYVRVRGWEQVTTPAGTFDTFRIDMTVRMINTKDQTRSQTYTFVLWYAPATNRWVKRTTEWRSEGRVRDSFSEELTEYSRKP